MGGLGGCGDVAVGGAGPECEFEPGVNIVKGRFCVFRGAVVEVAVVDYVARKRALLDLVV